MRLPRISAKTLLYFFLLVIALLLVAEGGYFFGFKEGKEKAATTALLPSASPAPTASLFKDKIEQHARRSTHLFSGHLTKIEENSWTLKVEGEEELTITDEFPETPPSFVLISFPEGQTTEVKREEFLIGDKVDIQIGITPSTGKTEVLRISKNIYQ